MWALHIQTCKIFVKGAWLFIWMIYKFELKISWVKIWRSYHTAWRRWDICQCSEFYQQLFRETAVSFPDKWCNVAPSNSRCTLPEAFLFGWQDPLPPETNLRNSFSSVELWMWTSKVVSKGIWVDQWQTLGQDWLTSTGTKSFKLPLNMGRVSSLCKSTFPKFQSRAHKPVITTKQCDGEKNWLATPFRKTAESKCLRCWYVHTESDTSRVLVLLDLCKKTVLLQPWT